MQAPIITTNKNEYKCIDGRCFAFGLDRASRQKAESDARAWNSEIAIAADRRAGFELNPRQLRDGYRAPDTRSVAEQIRDGKATITPQPQPSNANPYRKLLQTRGKYSKQWFQQMEKQADEWDRVANEKAAKQARIEDPLWVNAITSAQSNVNLCKLDCLVPQSQLDERTKLLEDLKSASIDPANYWERCMALDAENKPIVTPSGGVVPAANDIGVIPNIV